MIPVLLIAAHLACDPALTALFTPERPGLGRYEVCTTAEALDVVIAEPRSIGLSGKEAPHFGATELLEPLDAFGLAGTYNRSALARLYGGTRVRVVRGWSQGRGRDQFESITLFSPYPDATLTHLMPGTMIVSWTVAR